MLQRPERGPSHRRQRHGGGFALRLVAGGGGKRQVHRDHHAGRQQRRRRNPRAAHLGTRHAPDRCQSVTIEGTRRLARARGRLRRHRIALRRRHHHAGDLGTQRDRRARGGRAGVASLRSSARAGDPRRPVLDPAIRIRPSGGGVRDHPRHVVRRDLRARRLEPGDARLRGLGRAGPALGRALLRQQRMARSRRARCGGPVSHRGRGAVRGHGPLRHSSDPSCVVSVGFSIPGPELPRSRRAASAAP